MIMIADVVNWVIANRENNAFKGYDSDKIASHLSACCASHMLCIVDTPEGAIKGVATAVEEVDNYIRIVNIIAEDTATLKQMLRYYISRFPNNPIIGVVRNRTRHFNDPTKLLRRLS